MTQIAQRVPRGRRLMARRVVLIALMMLLLACGQGSPAVATSANATVASGETAPQFLLRNFRKTYAPLQACLTEKVGGVATPRAAQAIVDAGQADELERTIRDLVWHETPGYDAALDAAVDPTTRVQRQLDLLAHHLADRDDASAEFASFRLLHEVAAAMVLADALGGACAKPAHLEYWARESERLDLYLNLDRDHAPLGECVATKVTMTPVMLDKIVAKDGLRRLEALAELSQDAPVSPTPRATTRERASALLKVISDRGVREVAVDESIERRLRSALAMYGFYSMVVDATNIDCNVKTDWFDVASNYVDEHPVAASPHPSFALPADPQ